MIYNYHLRSCQELNSISISEYELNENACMRIVSCRERSTFNHVRQSIADQSQALSPSPTQAAKANMCGMVFCS